MKKTLKVLALAGALSVGVLAGAHAQALTSATTLAAETPLIVGIGATVGTVQVSSSVATSLTLQMPNPGRIVGVPFCSTYDITGAGPLVRRYTYTSTTGVVAVNTAPSQVSGTVAVNDQVYCTAVYRP